jgi:hypothetical protein
VHHDIGFNRSQRSCTSSELQRATAAIRCGVVGFAVFQPRGANDIESVLIHASHFCKQDGLCNATQTAIT